MKCLCNHCSREIEFEEGREGETVSCLHCELDTVLYVIPATKNPVEEEAQKQKQEELQAQRYSAVIKAKLRIQNKRVCKRCEQEVSTSTLAGGYGMLPPMLLIAGVPTVLFAYYLGITLIVISLVLLIVFCFIEACPKCKSTDVVRIDTPAAERILGAQ